MSGRFLSTIGIDFSCLYLRMDNGATLKLMIWDTAGQERYRAITKAYYRNSNAIIVVYNVNYRESFDNVNKWLKDIEENTNN